MYNTITYKYYMYIYITITDFIIVFLVIIDGSYKLCEYPRSSATYYTVFLSNLSKDVSK